MIMHPDSPARRLGKSRASCLTAIAYAKANADKKVLLIVSTRSEARRIAREFGLEKLPNLHIEAAEDVRNGARITLEPA